MLIAVKFNGVWEKLRFTDWDDFDAWVREEEEEGFVISDYEVVER